MIDCNNPTQPLVAIVAALMALDGNGVNHLRAVEVDTTNSMDYFDCTNPGPTVNIEQVFRLCVGFDDNNNPAIRVGFVTNSPTNAVECGTLPDATVILKKCVGKTAESSPGANDGVPFLRIWLQPL